eukprot:6213147-Pleurochrysis_carterae.AAC.5
MSASRCIGVSAYSCASVLCVCACVCLRTVVRALLSVAVPKCETVSMSVGLHVCLHASAAVAAGSMGITAEEAVNFVDPTYWLTYFPPKGMEVRTPRDEDVLRRRCRPCRWAGFGLLSGLR